MFFCLRDEIYWWTKLLLVPKRINIYPRDHEIFVTGASAFAHELYAFSCVDGNISVQQTSFHTTRRHRAGSCHVCEHVLPVLIASWKNHCMLSKRGSAGHHCGASPCVTAAGSAVQIACSRCRSWRAVQQHGLWGVDDSGSAHQHTITKIFLKSKQFLVLLNS